MEIESILNIEDMEKPRSIIEFRSWVESIYELISKNKVLVNYTRQKKGLSKEYLQEIYPLLRFAEAKYGQTHDVVLRPKIGSQRYDAIVSEVKTNITYKVEITFAVNGYEELHRMLLLEKNGSISTYADLDIKGSKNKGYNYNIKHNSSRDDIFNKYIQYVEDVAIKKIKKTYENVPVLIVGVDDVMVLWNKNDANEFKDIINAKLGHLNHKFQQIWVVGMSGDYHQLIRKTNKTLQSDP